MYPDLPDRVVSSIDRFTGRAWLLPHILNWWDKSDDRLFLLTGDPGTGKSMIVAWLAGGGPLPAQSSARTQLECLRGVVKAAHFCQAASRNVTPQAFAESIASQLTGRVRGFGDALASTLADRVQINVTQAAGSVASGGTMTGVSIDRIDLGTLGDELSFDRAFTLPIKKLYASGYSDPMLLLVDALDEAQTYTGQVTLPELLSRLDDLPRQVRLLTTARDEPRVLRFFRNVPLVDLVKEMGAGAKIDDVRAYAEGRLFPFVTVEEAKRKEFAERLAKQADGVFLYAAMVLDDLLEQPTSQLPDLGNYPLPDGLSGLYHAFLTRELGKDDQRWFDLFEPLLGLIAVAQGDGLTTMQLADIVGKDIRAALRACKQYLAGELPNGPFRPFHKSFADFLLEDEYNLDYHVDAKKMHGRIAEHYWTHHQDWSKCDDYGLKYLPRHLRSSSNEDRLFELITAPFMTAKKARLRSPVPLLGDLSLVMRAAREQSPVPTRILVRACTVSSNLINTVPPLVIDTLARAGQMSRAQLLAENTAFPLDRCRAMSWLAQRAHEQQEATLSRQLLDEAVRAVERVMGSYQAMATSFCVDAAVSIGQEDLARSLARGALSSACEALSGVGSKDAMSGRERVTRIREKEHLLLWTGRVVRSSLGPQELGEVRLLAVGGPKWGPFNLDFQLAAIVGDMELLDTALGVVLDRLANKEPSGWQYYGMDCNLALALADAGRVEDARALMSSIGERVENFDDNVKRLAWAAALCDEWDRAFELVGQITHAEEAARALHRVQEVAVARGVEPMLQRGAEISRQRLGSPPESGVREQHSGSEQHWRAEAWLVHVLAVAGRFDRAVPLVEEICRRGVRSNEANSLCYPTAYSADRRRHVVPQDPFGIEDFSRELLRVAQRADVTAPRQACERLEGLTAQPAWRDMGRALAVIEHAESVAAARGWFDAFVAAASIGRAEIGAVAALHRLIQSVDPSTVSEVQIVQALNEGDVTANAILNG